MLKVKEFSFFSFVKKLSQRNKIFMPSKKISALFVTVCGMKSCRLRAIHYPVTQKLKRATTLE